MVTESRLSEEYGRGLRTVGSFDKSRNSGFLEY